MDDGTFWNSNAMNYDIEYEVNGKRRTETYTDMKDVGMAFAWCLHENPGCKLIRARSFGKINREPVWVDYAPPPVQRHPVKEPRAARALNKKEKGCEFKFYDQVKSQKL